MIKFFRHIRKTLLMENKTSKYFKYAIGEIILVVIGILIALQINNWNEQKDNEERIKTTLLQIQDDLLNDIQEIVPIELDYQNRALIINQFLNDSKPRSYFEENVRELARGTLNFRTFVQSNQSFINLKSQIAIIPKKYQNVLIHLNRLYVENSGLLSKSDNEVQHEIETYRSSLYKKYNWMEDYYNPNMTDEVKDYFLTSEAHRRQLVFNEQLFFDHSMLLGLIKSHSILCYLIIKEALEDTSELPEVIKQFKLDYPNSTIEDYIGSYERNGELFETIEKRHGILYMITPGSEQVQLEGAMLQEKAKDSLVWLLNNQFLLEFKRDSLNNVDGFFYLDISKEEERKNNYYKKVRK